MGGWDGSEAYNLSNTQRSRVPLTVEQQGCPGRTFSQDFSARLVTNAPGSSFKTLIQF